MWVRFPPSASPSRKPCAWRDPYRRWRLPGAERRHPRGGAAGARARATRSSASARAGAGSSRGGSSRSGRARSPGSCRAAGRSSALRGRTRTRSTAASTPSWATSSRSGSTRSSRSAARTLSASPPGCTREHDFPVVGVPKTIDNDLSATDYTFGFDTAVSICDEAIDRLHTTAESHNRVMVVEVMGRHTGWIAVMSGIAGGADVILIPEQPITIEEACAELRRRHERGKDFSIVVVSARATSWTGRRARTRRRRPRRSSGTCACGGRRRRARAARSRSGPATRPASPSSATSSAAAPPRRATACSRRATASRPPTSSHEGRFGRMAALHGDAIVDVSLAEATAELKTVPQDVVRRRARLLRLELCEGKRTVLPRRHEEVLAMRGVQHRVETLRAGPRLERERASRLAARRPSPAGCGGSRRSTG